MQFLQSPGRLLPILIAFTALSSSGCSLIAAGVCAGCIAGKTYRDGKVCQSFDADFNDTWEATKAALHELGMPIEKEECCPTSGFILARNSCGEKVKLYFSICKSKVPIEKPLTKVGVRVAFFGDRSLSCRVLYQISSHLVPPAMLQPVPVMPAPEAEAPPPRPVETPPQD